MLKRVEIAREVIAGFWGSGDKRVSALRKAGYNPDTVQGDVNTLLCCNENILNGMNAMARSAVDARKFHYVQFTDATYTHQCPDCHKRNYDRGGNCIWWAFYLWHHGGGLPCACNCGVLWNQLGDRFINMSDAQVIALMREHIGISEIKLIRNGNRPISKSMLNKGDLLMFYNKDDTYQHMGMYMGNGKITDNTSGRTPNVDYGASYDSYNNRIPCLFAIRYTGNGLCPPPKRTIEQLAYEVIEGLWGSGDSRKTALTQAGHNYNAVQDKVNEILNPPKPIPKPPISTLVAVDVINGDYGNGQNRVNALRRAGYNPDVIQNEVNRLMADSKKKSIDTLAREVIAGYWKSGKKREKVLKACGCNYDAIQNRVNEILGVR